MNYSLIPLTTLYIKEVKRFIKVGMQTIIGPAISSLLFLAVFVLFSGKNANRDLLFQKLTVLFFLDLFIQKLTVFCFFTPVVCFRNWLLFWTFFWTIFGPFPRPSHRPYSILWHANHGLYRHFRVSILDAFWSSFSDRAKSPH